MLTEFETRVINSLYNVGCKHWMSPFTWTGERMLLKPKTSFFGTLWNWFTSVLLLSTIMFEFQQIHAMIGRRELNGVILAGTLLMSQFGHLSVKLNTLCSKTELVHVINQTLLINSNWGTDLLNKYFFFQILIVSTSCNFCLFTNQYSR